ncbi:MAG: hypothetical protein SP1CHLAM54_17190 [Chlamydiia bacterium]|nr:hypothetical protein [Chlamydiia bacterium]MCH9616607.1 hypothetical protein [Chlamydiia bacterium]MCH9629337.1 hypothetical protein [Chlamydiia bacterium]
MAVANLVAPGPDPSAVMEYFETARFDWDDDMVRLKGMSVGRVGLHKLHVFAMAGDIPHLTDELTRMAAIGAGWQNLRGPSGHTPLHFAALTGQVEAIKVLCAFKADTKRRADDGGLPEDVWLLTKAKIAQVTHDYPLIDGVHFDALDLFKMWCFGVHNVLSTRILSPASVIDPTSLEVRVHEVAGRILIAPFSIPGNSYIGPYGGCTMSRLLSDASNGGCIDARYFPDAAPVKSGEYVLGHVDAAKFGNTVAMAPDGSGGYFCGVDNFRGLAHASFLHVTFPIPEEGVISVDYGDTHPMRLQRDYVDLTPEQNHERLKQVLETPAAEIKQIQKHFVCWAVSTPPLMIKWLQEGVLDLSQYAQLCEIATHWKMPHTLKVLKLLGKGREKFFLTWLEAMVNQGAKLRMNFAKYIKAQEKAFEALLERNIGNSTPLREFMEIYSPVLQAPWVKVAE